MPTAVVAKGVLLLLILTFLFGGAYVAAAKKHFRAALIWVTAGGFTMRLWCAFDPFLHDWDERYHALIAKHLAQNPFLPTLYHNPLLPYDFQQWALNHVWLHKQPLTLWLMAGSIHCLGTTEGVVRLPSLVFSTLSIVLTYKIARFFGTEKMALLAAFFHAINGIVVEIASGRHATDHVDTGFFFFVELSVWLTIHYAQTKRQWPIVALGLSLGAALLSKALPALIVLPLFWILNASSDGWRRTIAHTGHLLFWATLVYAPWQVYAATAFPREYAWENAYNWRHLTEALEGQGGSVWWHLDNARIIWNELIYGVWVWFALRFFRHPNDSKYRFLAVWVGVPYAFFSLVATKMTGYVLFVAPAIFILEAQFCQFFWKKTPQKWHLGKIIALALVFLSIRYGVERLKPFDPQLELNQRAATIATWKKITATHPKAVIFNAEHYVACMFYVDDVVAYPYLPSLADVSHLRQQGYEVFIAPSPQLDTTVYASEPVTFLP